MFLILVLTGIVAGGLYALQGVLNSALSTRLGNMGAVAVSTVVSIVTVTALIVLFPSMADLRDLPGLSEWYLYGSAPLRIAILAIPIVLIPRLGAATTFTALVVGQLLTALVVDQFGLFGFPQIAINPARVAGVALLIGGVILVKRER